MVMSQEDILSETYKELANKLGIINEHKTQGYYKRGTPDSYNYFNYEVFGGMADKKWLIFRYQGFEPSGHNAIIIQHKKHLEIFDLLTDDYLRRINRIRSMDHFHFLIPDEIFKILNKNKVLSKALGHLFKINWKSGGIELKTRKWHFYKFEVNSGLVNIIELMEFSIFIDEVDVVT